MKRPQHIVPIAFYVALGIAVLLIVFKPHNEPATAKEKARPVETISVELKTISPSIPLFVQVTTPLHAHIKSAISADVKKLHQLEGAQVDKDKPLIQLDDREANLHVQQRLADVRDIGAQIENENLQHENKLYVIGDKQGARAKHNRAQIIKGHKIRITSLNAKRQRATALLKLAQLDVQRTQITAPFNGKITALHVSTGDRVRPGDPLIDMYDTHALELSGPVPDRHLSILQAALQNNLTLEASAVIHDQKIKATLTRLSGAINERSGTIDAIFDVADNAAILTLGQQLRIALKLPPKDRAFAIPATALYGNNRVYKVIDNRLAAVHVTVLGEYVTDNDIQQLAVSSEGLDNNSRIIITQLPDVIENLLVKPIDQL